MASLGTWTDTFPTIMLISADIILRMTTSPSADILSVGRRRRYAVYQHAKDWPLPQTTTAARHGNSLEALRCAWILVDCLIYQGASWISAKARRCAIRP